MPPVRSIINIKINPLLILKIMKQYHIHFIYISTACTLYTYKLL